jgi:hypothetical protein
MTPEVDFQPFQSNAPRVGMITQWVDDKGYGWRGTGVGGNRVQGAKLDRISARIHA